MKWTCRIAGGPRRVNHAAAAVDHLIYSFGGYCTGDNYRDQEVLIDVFVLNTLTLRWARLPTPTSSSCVPFQRYGHTVAAYEPEKAIYLFGGRNDDSLCNVLYRFDTRTRTWSVPAVTGQVPYARDGHSACIINHEMYIFGGYEETFYRFGLDVYKLDLKTMKWSFCECSGDPPSFRDFHTATAIDDRYMYVFGGRSDTSGGYMQTEYYTNKLNYLDTSTMTWCSPKVKNQPSTIPEGRRSHSAVNVNEKLLIFGGYNGRVSRHFNDLWEYDPEQLLWTKLHPTSASRLSPEPCVRRRQAMCKVEDKIYLFGGTSPYDGPPIAFTPAQLNFNPQDQDANLGVRLIDHNDTFVLDLRPSLKTMCIGAVLKAGLDVSLLPANVRAEIANMTTDNTISTDLKTLANG